MCVTTFFTQKQIMKRSGPVEGQAAMVQKLMLYGMPLSLFVSGFFFPIGVLLYWFTNNLWTLGQQFYILKKMPPPGSPAAKAKAAADKPAIDPKALAPSPAPSRSAQGRPPGRPASTADARDGSTPSPFRRPAADGRASAASTARPRRRAGTAPGRPGRPPAVAGAGGGQGGQGPANRGKRKRR
jgi:YidC/Oxa1 family membrane protein insertase